MCYISLGYCNILYIFINQAREIDDQSCGNNKQSGFVQIHERAEKNVQGIVYEFCLIFSPIKAVSQLVQNRTEAFCALLLHY